MQILRKLRSYFFRGMAALLPTVLTVWFFVQFYLFIQKNVSSYVNRFIVRLLLWLGSSSTEQELVSFWVSGKGQVTGFVVVLILISVIGVILASVVGRSLWRMVENALMNIPLVSRVYPYIKQVTDAVFNKENNLAFKRVVAVEYPRRDAWSVAFVTGSGLRRVVNSVDDPMLTLFIPSSPMPFTGYVIMVKETDTIPLEMSIEEALRFTVSGGVITPTHWRSLHADDEQEPNAS
jgi:uncharacterized membrane protein